MDKAVKVISGESRGNYVVEDALLGWNYFKTPEAANEAAAKMRSEYHAQMELKGGYLTHHALHPRLV
jgi:hypothetical protein